ncbi:hypothetical protein PALU110988_14245 [Paenibacillus lupini]|uniref:hypothetical protein n=1 Tax=Paenibacillus lupini TaxID=1450204 RepID=UPI001420DB84|nr:hypothetical protein [Paenibacillus lupini]NIK25076.1 hypothetical protein [Paenibacillus lupini]
MRYSNGAIGLLFLLSGCSESHNLTINDIESSFTKAGVKYTEQLGPSEVKKSVVYNGTAPALILHTDEDLREEGLKVYLYTSDDERKKGLEQFQEEQSKDLTYGMKETAMYVHNAMFVSFSYTEEEWAAIKKLK